MAEPRASPPSAPSASQCSQFPPPSSPSASQCSQLPPPSAPSASHCSQLPPPSLGGLIPPSHFVLRPRAAGAELWLPRGRGQGLEEELNVLRGRSQSLEAELERERRRSQRLEAELEREKGRSQDLKVELDTEKKQSQNLEAELGVERGRSQHLEAELGVERGRSQHLEAELGVERGRSQHLEAELSTEKGRSQRLEEELVAERGRSQRLEEGLAAERRRSQRLEAELAAERGRGQPPGAELEALRGRGQQLEAELELEKGRSQILEAELEMLRGRGLDTEGAEPSPEQVLLSRWRLKVFQLLLQVRLHRDQELRLQGQVRSLGAAVASGSRQVSLLEERLRRGEEELQGERQALSQQRLRAEAAEEELGKLSQGLSRLLSLLSLSLSAAIAALGSLGERLGRAQERLRALVASGRLRWQREQEGTPWDSGAVAPAVTKQHPWWWHPRGPGGGPVPKVSPPCPLPATEGRDGTRPGLGTVSLAPLLKRLQALGAAILGDIGDSAEPPPPRDAGDVIRDGGDVTRGAVPVPVMPQGQR